MTFEAFNTLGGVTIGIPPKPVITEAGVVTAEVNTTANVTANMIVTDQLKYVNGDSYIAGSNSQILFNNNGRAGASPNLMFNSVNNTLSVPSIAVEGTTYVGDVSTLSITGGVNGYFLQTDGLGTLTWAAAGGGGGNGIPGGSNSQVQFNNAGSFAGSANFTFNQVSNTISVGNVISTFTGNLNGIATSAITADTVTFAAQPAITSVGTLSNLTVSGNVVASLFSGSGANLTNLNSANISGTVAVANVVSDAAQPNITSVGTLTELAVTGNVITTGIISTNANVAATNVTATNLLYTNALTATGNVAIGGNINIANTSTVSVLGNLNATGSANISLGAVETVHITGGINGYVLATDGAGNLTWTAKPGGPTGNGVPGGSNTQVQFNNAGEFGGSSLLTFNESTVTMNVGGTLQANALAIGSGVYKFCTSNVFFASTSTTSNTALYGVEANSVSSIDFTIVSTDTTAGARQVSKISAIIYDATLHYTEYSSLNVNGFTGNFTVGYDPGDVMNPAQAILYVTPTSSNLMQHKIMITGYEP